MKSATIISFFSLLIIGVLCTAVWTYHTEVIEFHEKNEHTHDRLLTLLNNTEQAVREQGVKEQEDEAEEPEPSMEKSFFPAEPLEIGESKTVAAQEVNIPLAGLTEDIFVTYEEEAFQGTYRLVPVSTLADVASNGLHLYLSVIEREENGPGFELYEFPLQLDVFSVESFNGPHDHGMTLVTTESTADEEGTIIQEERTYWLSFNPETKTVGIMKVDF